MDASQVSLTHPVSTGPVLNLSTHWIQGFTHAQALISTCLYSFFPAIPRVQVDCCAKEVTITSSVCDNLFWMILSPYTGCSEHELVGRK